MKLVDPTYLRTIVDGLSAGKLQKDNPANLPEGLIGIYEEALAPSENVNERKRFLDFFIVWALLKKEVSVSFVSELLEDWSEEDIVSCINKYSKWFNSPVIGLYTLYHERLRTFLLQKTSQKQFTACNKSIIKRSQAALDIKSSDEWEYYALEYLSAHLLIPAIESGDASYLKALSYNTAHWNRQIEISKRFDWSKRMLDDMMLWASKYDDEEVIECALNKVDLYHIEQNDAPRIVELVANNEIETALQRIEAFGGNDKEGLQRKFILYMLCLMELTLLESKEQPWRKESIESLLKHLDDNLPVDHSILNWNDFFPSYLMFQIACICNDLELDYLLLYRRTSYWNHDWITNNSDILNIRLSVILRIANEITDLFQNIVFKCNLLICIQNSHLFDELFDLLFKKIEQIEASHFKNIAKSKLLEVLILYNKMEAAGSYAHDIEVYYLKDYFRVLCQYYLEQNDINSGLMIIDKINDEASKIESVGKCILYFIERDDMTRANFLLERFIYLYQLLDEDNHNEILDVFFLTVMKCGKYDIAIKFANELKFNYDRNKAFYIICTEFAYNNQLDQAKAILDSINLPTERCLCYAIISKSHLELNEYLESVHYFNLSIEESNLILEFDRDEWDFEFSPRCEVLDAIAIEFAGLDEEKFNSILTYVREIKSTKELLTKIILHPKNYKEFLEVSNYLLKISSNHLEFSHYSEYINLCEDIAKKYIENSQVEQAIIAVSKINNKHEHDRFIGELLNLCLNKQDFDFALIIARQFANLPQICDSLLIISGAFAKSSNFDKAATTLLAVKEYVDQINYNEHVRQEYLFQLSKAYLHIEMESTCLLIIDLMNDQFVFQELAITNFLKYYFNKNKLFKHDTLLNKLSKRNKSRLFKDISIEEIKDDLNYSIVLSNQISVKSDKIEAQIEILKKFVDIGNSSLARKMAYDCVNEISEIKEERDRCQFAIDLAISFSRIGDWRFALETCDILNIKATYAKKEAFLCIINQMLDNKVIKEAMELIRNIENYVDSFDLIDTYQSICIELIKKGCVFEFQETVKKLNENYSYRVFNKIVLELIKLNKFEVALQLARNVANIFDKIRIFLDISEALIKNDKLSYSRAILREAQGQFSGVRDSDKRCMILSIFSVQLAKHKELDLSEKFSLEVPQTFERNYCWKQIGSTLFEEHGFFKSIQLAYKYKSFESRKCIKQNITKKLGINNITREICLSVLKDIENPISSMEHVLQIYALNQLFFEELGQKKVQRYNHSLNLQWAIDIKNSINEN
jgi:hypothetical protein